MVGLVLKKKKKKCIFLFDYALMYPTRNHVCPRTILLPIWWCLSMWMSLFQIFTVQLTLGEQVWEAEGTSIKKAQHSTAAKALAESVLPRPAPRSPKVDVNSNPGTANNARSYFTV